MKNHVLTLLFATGALVALHAQKVTKSEKIKESQVPQAVKEMHDNSIGFPAEEWIKLTVNDVPRYVAVVQQMDPSSGKTLQNRYRYADNGRRTSSSQYRGNGKGEGKDFLSVYLGTGGVDAAFENKIAKLIQENTLVSFEGFGFSPGNQTDQYLSTHRLVLKDKKGQRVILYFDKDGKEIDMSKYPVRRLEAEEID